MLQVFEAVKKLATRCSKNVAVKVVSVPCCIACRTGVISLRFAGKREARGERGARVTRDGISVQLVARDLRSALASTRLEAQKIAPVLQAAFDAAFDATWNVASAVALKNCR